MINLEAIFSLSLAEDRIFSLIINWVVTLLTIIIIAEHFDFDMQIHSDS